MKIDSAGSSGERHRILGTDGGTLWGYDPATNRYTLQPASPALGDPRALTAIFGPTAGTTDLEAALAAFQASPGGAATLEGTEAVLSRVAQVVLAGPVSCGGLGSTASAPTAPSGASSATGPTTTTESYCTGTTRYWLDTATGWVLRAEADDGRGGGFGLETDSATFDAPIDASLFAFTPPPGSVQVDFLN